ncbi:MAG: hypothetical protein HOJ35_01615 [Bdellovibrionales bacterium]|jgi:hypothetical protein|nr:hypothetical protein [Bdellovibrionales bacterium]
MLSLLLSGMPTSSTAIQNKAINLTQTATEVLNPPTQSNINSPVNAIRTALKTITAFIKFFIPNILKSN